MKNTSLESCRVLLCFNNEQICKPIHQFFTQAKAERVVYAHNNGEASQKMNERPFNLFIIENDFPTLGGSEFSRFIRLGDGEMAEAPIIMFMYEPSRENVIAAINAGVNEIIGPPFTVSSLQKYIEHVMSNPRPFVRTEKYSGPARPGTDDLSYSGK